MTDCRHYRSLPGNTVFEHEISVPEDYSDPSAGSRPMFTRELVRGTVRDQSEVDVDAPVLCYLQGGPGFPSPRLDALPAWVDAALERYRVVLPDERGTGRSAGAPPSSVAELRRLRADNIIRDLERLREALGIRTWTLLGQSFGGFCATHYLATGTEAVDRVLLTGGLPATDCGIDDGYRATYAKTAERHQELYREFPGIDATIRKVCHHLDNSDERLPTGERLSSRRLRTVGIDLGRGMGPVGLGMLFAAPFITVRGEQRLRPDFLHAVGQRVSFSGGAMYAAIHESIYGGTVPGPTAWSAHRIREEVAGFAEAADPSDASAPFYLTGEHVYPWQFEEDPALQGFKGVAEELAGVPDWASLYDFDAMRKNRAEVVAAIYVDDMFVPMEYSIRTLSRFSHGIPLITNEWQHDGLRVSGRVVFDALHRAAGL